MRYNNYHKHDYYSNVRTPDVIVSPQHYIDRAKELGHTTFFTTNHGCSSNLYEAYGLCKKNDLKCVFGMEMYYVDDMYDKSNRNNFHLVAIALNADGMRDINRINSVANKDGFYYHPRIDKSQILSIDPKNVIITSACVNNRLNRGENDGIEQFLLPFLEHFQDHFFLEVQSHNHEVQIRWNKTILQLSKQYGVNIIHGCDSHYIYEEQYRDRLDFLNGKGMNYGDENDFILDYPSYENIVERYRLQGVLNDEQIDIAIKNTLVFDKAEDLGLNNEIKMPTIYPELSVDDRFKKLLHIVKDKFKQKLKTVPKDRHQEYYDALKYELDIIKNTNTPEMRIADYFLINERIINKGINEYDGILTRTGRGSAVSFFANHLLGFTEIDRLDAEVPLYPTRFISTARLLDSRSVPDIDFNTASPEPFIKASKDILGEDGCYYMVAYGRMKSSGAFRNMCRVRNIPMEEYNEFGKMVSETDTIKDKEQRKRRLNELCNDYKFGEILKESMKFVGVIDSISPSPCSFLLLDKPISEEIGLMRIGNEICACIDGYTSDVWKFLKNDILTVTVWDIISKTYELINKPIPTIPELRERLDDKVWELYSKGLTATLNQTDTDFATGLVKKYGCTSVRELCSFVASIRPSFASQLDGFINRIPHSNGVEALDKLLESSDTYLLYQEDIMSYLTWLGIKEDETYDILKLIAKKKMTKEQQNQLKDTLKENWIKVVGTEDKFNESWDIIEASADYLFNASHALSVAWDNLYGAELKAHYPLEYYTVILDVYKDNVEKTAKIHSELEYFGIKIRPIKFRYSRADYTMDKSTNSIYKGLSSVKFLNENISNELYSFRNNQYESFIELLTDIKQNTSVNSRQLQILCMLGFFSEFGKSKKLLTIISLYDNIYSRKQIKFDDLHKLGLDYDIMEKYSKAKTAKMYKDIDNHGLIKELASKVEDEGLTLKDRMSCELEYMGYIDFTHHKAKDNMYFVSGFKVGKDKAKPTLQLYRINSGETITAKITRGQLFIEQPFGVGVIMVVDKMNQRPKMKMGSDGKWVKSDTEFENIVDSYDIH